MFKVQKGRIASTLTAWLMVMKGNIGDHKKMMRRSYALAFGAVTLRFYIWLFNTVGNGVNFEHNYLIIAFASWVPNLLVAEWINWREGKPLIHR